VAKEKTLTVKILGHPGHPKPEESGVQTSEGDLFHGTIVELPEDEARLLIGSKRAKETDEKAGSKAKKSA
jgi:hypothetical protein